jgi:hypothetical protein
VCVGGGGTLETRPSRNPYLSPAGWLLYLLVNSFNRSVLCLAQSMTHKGLGQHWLNE